jgi:methylene-tetrahydromethanopterin dehydrogenase
VADGSDDARKSEILNSAEAVFAAGRAGVQILSKVQVGQAKKLLIAADVNAVPPSGIEGLEVKANGEELSPGGALGIGALAIGGIKYQTEFGLFQKMTTAAKPVQYDFRDAFALARELHG